MKVDDTKRPTAQGQYSLACLYATIGGSARSTIVSQAR
jgi:hypothetical protein